MIFPESGEKKLEKEELWRNPVCQTGAEGARLPGRISQAKGQSLKAIALCAVLLLLLYVQSCLTGSSFYFSLREDNENDYQRNYHHD